MASKARIAFLILIYALALLNVAAGVPKILQMPQELGFLGSIGFSEITVSLLGVLQLAGGLVLFWPRFRLLGAIVVAIALLVSSVAIFAAGDSTFGAVSLLPFAVALVVAYRELSDGSKTIA